MAMKPLRDWDDYFRTHKRSRKDFITEIQRRADMEGLKLRASETSRVCKLVLDVFDDYLTMIELDVKFLRSITRKKRASGKRSNVKRGPFTSYLEQMLKIK